MLWFILLFFMILMIYSYQKEGFENKDILIVVSRYNEQLEWMKEEPFSNYKSIVYNKGPNDHFYHPGKVIPLKNVGREGHTYLYHIVKHYDDLNEITIFLPGSLNMDNKMQKGKRMMYEIEHKHKAFFITDSDNISNLYDFTISEYSSTSSENHSINPESMMELSKIRPFGKWCESYFDKHALTHYSHGGILSVSKKDVLQKPKSYYKELLEELSHSSNPEVGHYVERSWQAIFNMKDTLIL